MTNLKSRCLEINVGHEHKYVAKFDLLTDIKQTILRHEHSKSIKNKDISIEQPIKLNINS